MIGNQKEVNFYKYCRLCKHKDEDEFDPESKCYDCLDESSRCDSHKPEYFERDESIKE